MIVVFISIAFSARIKEYTCDAGDGAWSIPLSARVPQVNLAVWTCGE